MMKTEELEKRFEEAKRIAKEASAFLLEHESLRFSVETKASNDYVTSADKKAEEIIISAIKASFPADSILGEETGAAGTGDCRWIIDPIDGTVDFMSSFPCYTVSIAFEVEKEIVFGVVSVPRQCELFSAFKGRGAYLNGKKISTDEHTALKKTLAILVPPHRYPERIASYMEKMARFYPVFTDMRSLGSAAISLCYVAAGRCTAYFETMLHIYDIAAGVIILKEAGGVVDFLSEHDSFIDVLATSKSAYEEARRCIDG